MWIQKFIRTLIFIRRIRGKFLTKISDELPAKTTTLDKYIKLIVEARGHVPFDAKADSLVLTNVKTHAAWRVPHYQY